MAILHQHGATGVFRYELREGRMTAALREALRSLESFSFDRKAPGMVVHTIDIDGSTQIALASVDRPGGGRQLTALEQRAHPVRDLRETLAAFLTEQKFDVTTPALEERLHRVFDIQRGEQNDEWLVHPPCYFAAISVRRPDIGAHPPTYITIEIAVPLIHEPERDDLGAPVGLLADPFNGEQHIDYADLALSTLASAGRYAFLRDSNFSIEDWTAFHDTGICAVGLSARICKAIDPSLARTLEEERNAYALGVDHARRQEPPSL